MSEVWIAPIFAILGTILGVSIPSIAKLLENKAMHSKENKEKHEIIIRKILTEYVPKLNYSLYLAKNYIKNKESSSATVDSPDYISDKIQAVQDFYFAEIKSSYPLEMHSNMTDLNSVLTWLCIDIGLDSIEDDTSNARIKGNIEKCERLIEDLTKHIDKNYI